MSTAALYPHERRDRTTGLVTTVVVHVLLLILFLFIGLKQFDPPLPEETVEVAMADFGTTDDGGGNTPTKDPGGEQSAAPVVPEEHEDVATEENSDVEVVKPKQPKPITNPKPKPEKPKEPTVDSRLSDALNNWNKPGQRPADGPDNSKPGDPGAPDGKPGGLGAMRGDGWELRGGSRGLARGPDLSERPQLQNATWVEVKVVVDRAGTVLRVSVANTGTADVAIQNVALRAAKTCRFVPLPDGPPEQAHYIKLRFFPG
ncbi:MAG: energy transducer TonB [Flavobacteriales bacterium]|nr:energy transducer TonB [Flavobacteriales bacterium]